MIGNKAFAVSKGFVCPRVWQAIKEAEDNPRVSRSLIAHVMMKYGFKSAYAKKFKVTTDSE